MYWYLSLISVCNQLTRPDHVYVGVYVYAEVGSGECLPGPKGGVELAAFCSDVNVQTKSECANKCTADKKCGGLSWDGPNVVCILYDYTPTKSGNDGDLVCFSKRIGGTPAVYGYGYVVLMLVVDACVFRAGMCVCMVD